MTPELKALSRNTDNLVKENDELNLKNKDLLDRIATLESSLKSEKSHSAALERIHTSDADLVKKKDEEISRLLNEIKRLQKSEDKVIELKAYLAALEKQDWSHQHVPYPAGTIDASDHAFMRDTREKQFGSTAFVGMLTPVYLQPLIDAIKTEAVAATVILKPFPILIQHQ